MCLDILDKSATFNVNFLGALSHKNLMNLIKESEVVILPSFAEAFPMSWLEAMALEKKIITSNIGWANELMINNETGLTINPKNIKEIRNAYFKISTKNKLNLEMQKRARQVILDRFNHSNISKNIDFYKKNII